MRGDKKSDTSISKFIRELGRIGIKGEEQNPWIIKGRDWIRGVQDYSQIEWIELSFVNEKKNLFATAGLYGIGKNGHKTTTSILGPI